MNINDFIIEYQGQIRLSAFLGVITVMGIWEVIAPRRKRLYSRILHWGNNLGLLVLNGAVLKLVFSITAVGLAEIASQRGWGIFNNVDVPLWVAVLAAVIALDFIIYLQHVLVHAVPVLWRLHRVHHADPDFDVTTGARFHPFEIILSMLIKFATIVVLGPPMVAVLIFEVLLNATAMFNHSNVRIPIKLDAILRLFVVTPDMHRVHHSVEDDEANSNFGFNIPWWDRMFGTYRAQPRAGHEAMKIGIHQYTDPKQVIWLHGLLVLPFAGKITGYTINRRQWGASVDGESDAGNDEG